MNNGFKRISLEGSKGFRKTKEGDKIIHKHLDDELKVLIIGKRDWKFEGIYRPNNKNGSFKKNFNDPKSKNGHDVIHVNWYVRSRRKTKVYLEREIYKDDPYFKGYYDELNRRLIQKGM